MLEPKGSVDHIGPRVSVIIPSYNHARYLPEALESVFAQTYSNIELILIDDGSTDDTQTAVRPYRDRMVYVKKTNGGLASARNAGLAHATGEYIAFMDADDVCLPERIATQVEFLELNRDVVLCSSDFSAFDGVDVTESSHIRSYYAAAAYAPCGVGGLYEKKQTVKLGVMPWSAAFKPQEFDVYQGQVYDTLIWGNFIHPPTMMVRRSVSERVGSFDQALSYGTDYDWILRVSRHGEMAYIDRALLKYRYSDGQMSSNAHLAKIISETMEVLEKLLAVDPSIVSRHPMRFRRRLGSCYQGLAYALSETNRLGALVSVARSLRYGVCVVQTLKVLAKVMVPRALLARLRSSAMSMTFALQEVDEYLGVPIV